MSRRRVPASARRLLVRRQNGLRRVRLAPVRVRRRAPHRNVYHVTAHKAASQWVRRLLEDRRTYRWTGLRRFNPAAMFPDNRDPRPVTERSWDAPFPAGTAVSPLYVDRSSFDGIDKPAAWRAFVVVRDPRDMVVSWYFSARDSHPGAGEIPRHRAALRGLDRSAGLRHAIDAMADFGHFELLRSWADGAPDDERIRVVRYEDLTGDHGPAELRALFAHLQLEVPASVLDEVIETHAFRRQAGRARGAEDRGHHLRRGVAGDWENHFDDTVAAHYRRVVGDLDRHLGYLPAGAGHR